MALVFRENAVIAAHLWKVHEITDINTNYAWHSYLHQAANSAHVPPYMFCTQRVIRQTKHITMPPFQIIKLEPRRGSSRIGAGTGTGSGSSRGPLTTGQIVAIAVTLGVLFIALVGGYFWVARRGRRREERRKAQLEKMYAAEAGQLQVGNGNGHMNGNWK